MTFFFFLHWWLFGKSSYLFLLVQSIWQVCMYQLGVIHLLFLAYNRIERERENGTNKDSSISLHDLWSKKEMNWHIFIFTTSWSAHTYIRPYVSVDVYHLSFSWEYNKTVVFDQGFHTFFVYNIVQRWFFSWILCNVNKGEEEVIRMEQMVPREWSLRGDIPSTWVKDRHSYWKELFFVSFIFPTFTSVTFGTFLKKKKSSMPFKQ